MRSIEAAFTALIVIDVQRAFDEIEAAGRRRNNPDAVANIAALIRRFRAKRMAIFHVRHASLDPDSRFQAHRPGFAVRDEARERPGEPVIVKTVNSAFIGTDLQDRLRQAGVQSLVIVGATTNHCVETTARMAGNLGYDTKLVRDATWTFDCLGVDGETYSADEVHRMSLANLSGEFAEIVTTAGVVRQLARS
jgi:nicotinamidase-related amidase